MTTEEFIDDLDKLLKLLPKEVQNVLLELNDNDDLLEIVLDLGRIPEARYSNHVICLGDNVLTRSELKLIVNGLGDFGSDNRVGIERTLHRISAIRNRRQEIVGLTCRVGRAIYGTVEMVRDLIESGESLLLMGRPGIGKTTALREIARVMADELGLRVVIIDTSNEIAGDGDIPHPAIGRARRMQVSCSENQHQVMIEAVENHMPQVIVIDEIGTELEANAARTIAERGVQLIATAHGNSIANLIKNPTLSDLIGGVQSVTLGDEEARRRKTQKTVLERASEPTFTIAIEMNSRTKWSIHSDVSLTVDSLLRGHIIQPQERELSIDGSINLLAQQEITPTPPRRNVRNKNNRIPLNDFSKEANISVQSNKNDLEINDLKIFCCGISRQLVDESIRLHQWPIRIVESLAQANVIFGLRNKLGEKKLIRKEAKMNMIPIYIIKSDNFNHVEKGLNRLIQKHKNVARDALLSCLNSEEREDSIAAMEECRLAIEKVVLPLGRPVELLPRSQRILQMQSDLVLRYKLKSDYFSHGKNQCLRIYPP